MRHRPSFLAAVLALLASLVVQGGSAQEPAAARDVEAKSEGIASEERPQLLLQAGHLDERKRELEEQRSRQGIAGPIVLICVAGGLATLLSLVAIGLGSSLPDMRRHRDEGSYDELYDANDDGTIDNGDLRSRRRATAGVVTFAAVHIVTAVFGEWWLDKRLTARRRLDGELRHVRAERKSIELKLGLSADRAFVGGALQARF